MLGMTMMTFGSDSMFWNSLGLSEGSIGHRRAAWQGRSKPRTASAPSAQAHGWQAVYASLCPVPLSASPSTPDRLSSQQPVSQGWIWPSSPFSLHCHSLPSHPGIGTLKRLHPISCSPFVEPPLNSVQRGENQQPGPR